MFSTEEVAGARNAQIIYKETYQAIVSLVGSIQAELQTPTPDLVRVSENLATVAGNLEFAEAKYETLDRLIDRIVDTMTDTGGG